MSRQGLGLLRAKNVTHVLGIKCYLCVRNGPFSGMTCSEEEAMLCLSPSLLFQLFSSHRHLQRTLRSQSVAVY